MARKLQHLQEKQSSLRPDPVGRPAHHPDRCRSSQSKPVAASSSTPPSITPSSGSIRPDTTKSHPPAAVCAATPIPDLIRPPVAQLETTGRLTLHSPEERPLTLPSGTPSHAPTHTPDVASHSSGNLHLQESHSASQSATLSAKTASTTPSSIVVRIPPQEAVREVQDPVDTTNIAGRSHSDELCIARDQPVTPKESSDWPAAVSMHASIASKSPNTAARLDKAHRRSISESRLPHRSALQFELSEPEAASASVSEEPTPLTTSRAIHQDITPPEPRRIKGARLGACPFETTLAQATRRIPYGASDKPLVLSNKAARVLDLPSAADARLSEELARLYLTLLPSHDATWRKQAFIIKLERLLHHEWPDKEFTVHAFGSTENLLATDLSDLDVCITTSWQGFATQTCRLSSFMHRAGMQNVVCRAGAKVPVVAVFDPELKVACDMNINNTLALRNTRLVRVYMEIDTRARQLAYFVKYWAKRRALNDAVCNTLTSYSWTLLVINFLQVREPPVLPCLHSWPHDTVPSLQGIDVSFADDVDKFGLRGFGRHNHESIGSLLVGFFHYYTYLFNYRLGVASVRSGCVVDRASKGFHPDQLFGIEEPFTTSRNLGNTADMDSHRGIHLELARAHELLLEERTFESICTPYVFRGAKTRRYQLNGGIKQGPRRPNQAGAHQARQSGRSGFYQPGNGQFGMHVADAMTADYGHFRHNNPEFHVNQGVPLEHLQFLQTAYPISLQYYQQMAQLMSAGAPQEDRARTDRHRQQELWRRRQPLQNLQNLSEQQLQRQENQLGPSHFPHPHQQRQQQQQQQQEPHRQQRQYQQQQQQAHRQHQRQSQRNLREATMPTFQMLSLPVDMNVINRQSSPRSAQANLFQNQAHPDIKQSLPETLDQLPTAPAASPNGYLNHVTPYQRSVSLAYCDALVQGLDTKARHPAPHQAPVEQVPASECSASSTTGMTRESSSQSGSSRSSPSTSAAMLFLDGSAPMPTTEQGSKVGIDSSDHHDEDKMQRPVAVSNRLGYNHIAARRQASPVRHRSAFPPIDLAQTNPIRTVTGKPSYARVASKPSSPTAHTGPLLSPTRATVR